MSSLAGRVSATAGAFFHQHSKHAATTFKQKLIRISPALSSAFKPLPIPSFPCTTHAGFIPEVLRHPRLSTELHDDSDAASTSLAASVQSPLTYLWRLGHDAALLDTVSSIGAPEQYANVSQTSSNHRKGGSSGQHASSMASSGDGAFDDASGTIAMTAGIEVCKVRQAYVGAKGILYRWSILSAVAMIALCGVHWLHAICTRGQEYVQPRFELMKLRSEPLRYWACYSCLLLCWLSLAFFLHWKVQRWVFTTMIITDPQKASEGGSILLEVSAAHIGGTQA